MIKCIVYGIALIGTTNSKISLKKKPGTYGHRTNKALLSQKGGEEEEEEEEAKKRSFVLNGIGRYFSFLTPSAHRESFGRNGLLSNRWSCRHQSEWSVVLVPLFCYRCSGNCGKYTAIFGNHPLLHPAWSSCTAVLFENFETTSTFRLVGVTTVLPENRSVPTSPHDRARPIWTIYETVSGIPVARIND